MHENKHLKTFLLHIFVFVFSLVVFNLSSALAVQEDESSDIIWSLAWKPDGSAIALGGCINGENGIYITDNNGIQLSKFATSGNVLSLAWSPDTTKIGAIVSGQSDSIHIWDVDSGTEITTISREEATTTYDLKWSADSEYLAYVHGLTITVIGSHTAQLTVDNSEQIQAFIWDRKSLKLIFISANQVLQIWDVLTNAIVHEQKLNTFVVSLALNPDGTRLALGSSDGTVEIWDMETYAPLSTLQAAADALWFLEWSPDGTEIMTAGSRSNITVWNVNNQKLIDTIEKQTYDFLESLAYSPYGGRIAYSTNQSAVGAPPLTAMTFDDYTENLLGGAIQIVVPNPSLEKIHSITEFCGLKADITQNLQARITDEQLPNFVMQVTQMSDEDMSSGCAADLIAVAEALQAKQ